MTAFRYFVLKPGFILVFLCILISFVSCKKKTPIDLKNLGLTGAYHEKYVAEYSPAQISSRDNIIIRLSNPPDKSGVKIGAELTSGVSISPSVKGKFILQDETTVAFIPDEKFENGQVYTVTIDLKSFYNKVEEGASNINLSVAIIEQSLSLESEGISYDQESATSSGFTLTGTIYANDYVDNKIIEKMLLASQQGNQSIKVSWTHPNDRTHVYTISGIQRMNEDSELIIKYDGATVDKNFTGERSITVLKKGTFAYIDAKVVNDGGKRVDLIFSDLIATNQDLNGLITLNDKTETINYDVIGNKVRVFLENYNEKEISLGISQNIKNKDGKLLGKSEQISVSFRPELPEVKLLRQGVIMPETDKVWLPFQAKNLKYVDISITKIYQNNVLQFLQHNNFENYYNLTPVGKEIINQKIELSTISPVSNKSKFQKYTLDLSRMVKMDKGAIYFVSIEFNKAYIDDYPCDTNENEGSEGAYGEDGGEEYYEEDYSSENPCGRYYHGNAQAHSLILSSNIGLIAKGQPDNTIHIIASDINTAEPMSGVEIEVYDFQKQLLSKSKVDNNGMARLQNSDKAAFVIAKLNGVYGYLNIQDNYANATSEFDVSGKQLKTGLDAFIYGERGVYRPGDTMHISVFLHNHSTDPSTVLTDQYPVRLIMEDSRGKVQYDRVSTTNTNHVYYFPIATKSGAFTGNWKATVQLGNENFYKTFKVETVKPNRLKISYANESKKLSLYENPKLQFDSKWLHGASAEGLRAEVDLTLTEREVSFKSYKAYKFSDPARIMDYTTKKVFEDELDNNGHASFQLTDDANLQPSSGVKAVLKTRVYEKSGNYSEDYISYDADKYESYVGVKLPESEWGGRYFKSGIKQQFPVVTLDPSGKPKANRKLSIGLYNAEWSWWYNENNYAILKYNTDTHIGALKTFDVTTNSKGEAAFSEIFDDYGNYLVRICDTESGHCTGEFFYTSKWGNPPSNNGAAQLLTITTDKESYNVGENINVRIPSNANSKIIISIEKGSEVDQIIKAQGKAKETIISIPVTKEMSPNIYLNVSLIQPYASNASGLPLRMYGIANVKIVDPEKIITPVIASINTLEPNKPFDVSISEKNGKDMTYTLAIVDEGLLDLTRFKTPNPIDHFFAKQSLGINTWDIYDKVMNPYGHELANLFSIGGDGENTNLNSVKKANRFIPAVKFLGPFYVKAGSKNNHKVIINNYVGSVRMMVIAKNKTGFGHVEKTCPVKKDLMVQNTLPRVLTPGDEISLSANVFAMNKNIKNVNVSVTSDAHFQSNGNKSGTMTFSKEGDQLINFPMVVTNYTGIGNIGSTVSSGNLNASESTEIDIRNPNPTRHEFKDIIVDQGKTVDIPYTLFGSRGTNTAQVELSNAPIINLGKRLDYLIQYPYGCIEQTTSSAFPQLYLADMIDFSKSKQQKIVNNISKAIQRLALFQVSNGGFAYWPGNQTAEDWATTYAGHFLIEAKSKAHHVPDNMIKKWAEYQRGRANAFNSTYDYAYHAQAYRLYTLAKYGKPEMGAMNQLKNQQGLDAATVRTLAAAYAVIGKKDIAIALISKYTAHVAYKYDYIYDYYTYGSDLRNKAMYVEVYQELGQSQTALSLVKSIVNDISGNHWYNTQAVAYALMVVQKFYQGTDKSGLLASISNGKSKIAVNTNKKLVVEELTIDDSKTSQSVRIVNQSKGKMYVRLNYAGKEDVSKGIAAIYSKYLTLNIKYTDPQGKEINVSNLKQGTNFIAKIEVVNNGEIYSVIENLALNFIVPAGWEINNERLAGIDRKDNGIEYQDIRDDRIISFFDTYARSRTLIQIPLTATYSGKFYFPPTHCEAMYNNEIFAMTASKQVVVSPSISNKSVQ